jgi:hypothetical protein
MSMSLTKTLSVLAIALLAAASLSPLYAIEHECGSPLLYGDQPWDYHNSHSTGWCSNRMDGEPISADCEERGFGDQREHVTDCYNTLGLCQGKARVYCPNNGSGYGNWVTVIANCPNTYIMRAGWTGGNAPIHRGITCTNPDSNVGERACGCTTNGTTSTMYGGHWESWQYVCDIAN